MELDCKQLKNKVFFFQAVFSIFLFISFELCSIKNAGNFYFDLYFEKEIQISLHFLDRSIKSMLGIR